MWPQSFCLPVTHDGMEGQEDQTEAVVNHVSDSHELVTLLGTNRCQTELEGLILDM